MRRCTQSWFRIFDPRQWLPALVGVCPRGSGLDSSSSAPGSGFPFLWKFAPAGQGISTLFQIRGSDSQISWEFAPANQDLIPHLRPQAVAPRTCRSLPPPARSWFHIFDPGQWLPVLVGVCPRRPMVHETVWKSREKLGVVARKYMEINRSVRIMNFFPKKALRNIRIFC